MTPIHGFQIGDSVIISNMLSEFAYTMGKINACNTTYCYIETECNERIGCEIKEISPVAYAELQITKSKALHLAQYDKPLPITFDDGSTMHVKFQILYPRTPNGISLTGELHANLTKPIVIFGDTHYGCIMRKNNGIRHFFSNFHDKLYVLDIHYITKKKKG